MASYYTLGASLRELSVDDTKIEQTTQDFVEELRTQVTQRDQALVDLVLLVGDNRNLVCLLQEKTLPEQYMPTVFSVEELETFIKEQKESLENDSSPVSSKRIPEYMQRFTRNYFLGKYQDSPFFIEDILSELYLEYAIRKATGFLDKWFQLNLYISNILASVVVKKYDLDRKKFLIGESDLVRILREGNLSELKLLEESDLVNDILKISEESDFTTKERRLDELKWKILDELTFADSFSINAMLAYLLKLQIVERWIVLDRERGKQRFKDLLSLLKKEGKEELNHFIQSTQK